MSEPVILDSSHRGPPNNVTSNAVMNETGDYFKSLANSDTDKLIESKNQPAEDYLNEKKKKGISFALYVVILIVSVIIAHALTIVFFVLGKTLSQVFDPLKDIFSNIWVVYSLTILKISVGIIFGAQLFILRENLALKIIVGAAYLLVCVVLCFAVGMWMEWLWMAIIIALWTIIFFVSHIIFLLANLLWVRRTIWFSFKYRLSKGSAMFRCVLLALSTVIFLNALPFGSFLQRVPTFWIVIIMIVIMALMYWAVMSEVYDENTYKISMRGLPEMIFFVFTLQLDQMLLCMSLPTIGTNSILSSSKPLQTSSKAHELNTEGAELKDITKVYNHITEGTEIEVIMDTYEKKVENQECE